MQVQRAAEQRVGAIHQVRGRLAGGRSPPRRRSGHRPGLTGSSQGNKFCLKGSHSH